MGEWSEYFEDFPEENPDNWVGGRYFGPNGAARYRQEHQPMAGLKLIARRGAAAAQQTLDREIAEAIRKGEQRRAAKAVGEA